MMKNLIYKPCLPIIIIHQSYVKTQSKYKKNESLLIHSINRHQKFVSVQPKKFLPDMMAQVLNRDDMRSYFS